MNKRREMLDLLEEQELSLDDKQRRDAHNRAERSRVDCEVPWCRLCAHEDDWYTCSSDSLVMESFELDDRRR